MTYSKAGESSVQACFGGAPSAARELSARARPAASSTKSHPARVSLTWPRTANEAELDRAAACLLGQVIGDNLGALVEFKGPEEIARLYPAGVRELRDGGVWDILAGQPTDDSELALALARTLVGRKDYDAEAAATAYGRWYRSHPFDVGTTTRAAMSAAARATTGKAAAARTAALRESQSNCPRRQHRPRAAGAGVRRGGPRGVPLHGHAAAPGGCDRCAGASDRDVLRRGPRDSRLLENQRARSVEQLHALVPAQPVERDLPGAR